MLRRKRLGYAIRAGPQFAPCRLVTLEASGVLLRRGEHAHAGHAARARRPTRHETAPRPTQQARPEDYHGGSAMILIGHLAPMLLPRVAGSLLCVVIGASIAILLSAIRYAISQRIGVLDQLGGVYGSIREQRMIARAGAADQGAVVLAGIQFLVLCCECRVLAVLLKNAQPNHPRKTDGVLALGGLCSFAARETTIRGAAVRTRFGLRSDLCRPRAAGPPGQSPSRRTAGNSPGWRPGPG
jgi:hypothetical protein